MSFASADDVAARLGRAFTAGEESQVAALLDDAEAIIRARIPNLDARVLTDANLFSLLVLVESKSVRRVMLNPGGIRQRSEGVDDFQQSTTYDQTISGSDTYITDDEWVLLGAGSSGSGSFSMAVGYR